MSPAAFRLVLPIALLVFAALVSAEEVRDYYTEPGLHPFKETQGQDETENIDPFSGVLQRQYTDIRIPGNGGMDIVVHRSYTNPQKTPGYHNVLGIGWQIGYGRIVVPAAHAGGICNLSNQGNTDRNPSIEHFDGAREMLFYNDLNGDGGNGSLITKSNWRAVCIDPLDPTQGMLVTSPGGVKYRMSVESTFRNSEGDLLETSYLTSEVEDVYGNWIEVEYGILPNRGASTQRYLTRIFAGTSSTKGGGARNADGREVTFSYIDQNDQPVSAGSLDVRLASITNHLADAPDQVWSFDYEEATLASPLEHMYGLKFFQLTKVTRPDGESWQYSYYPEIVVGDLADSLSLHAVTYPQGGVVTYDYQTVYFYTWLQLANTATRSILTKTTSGSDIAGGTWTYLFEPGSYAVAGHNSPADVTTITRPDGTREKHYHYGHSYSLGYYDLLWAIGLKFQKEIYGSSNQLVETAIHNWGKRRISGQWYMQGLESVAGADRAAWAPVLLSEWASQYDGNSSGYGVDYSAHDKFGNPRTIEASRAIGSYSDKITDITYYNNEQKWIIGRRDQEEIEGVSGSVDRQFDAYGSITSLNNYSNITTYTYTVDGDVATVRDGRNNTATYSDYRRGIARLEVKPEDNIQIIRGVTDAGLVADLAITSNSDVRDIKRLFTYDGINRLSSIDFPIGEDVSVQWLDADHQTLIRGDYEESTLFDGFGRKLEFTRRDNASQEAITIKYAYDVFGRKIFESLPNETAKGSTYSYTPLDDIKRIDYENGDYNLYNYLNEIEVTIEDGRGNTVEYLYNIYGLPGSEKTIYRVETPVNITIIEHNLMNLVTRISQGQDSGAGLVGFSREYFYNSYHYLIRETHPEISSTGNNANYHDVVYGRDQVGNMISKRFGFTNSIYYEYDKLNRLKRIDYSEALNGQDVNFLYNKEDQPASISTPNTARVYTYDHNGNLTNETITIDQQSYDIGYTYDVLDAVASITYPSGRSTALNPDALGRSTAVGPYATGIAYHPSGVVAQFTYGNGLFSEAELDPDRLWIKRLTVGQAPELVDIGYGYDLVGNVVQFTNAVVPSENKTLTYDGANRLISTTGVSSESFTYDAQDDITSKAGRNYNYWGRVLQTIARPGAGFIQFVYDGQARVIREQIIGVSGYRNVYSYDHADNLISAEKRIDSILTNAFLYGYDGKNNRVSRTTGGSTTHYVYSDSGLLMGEYRPGNVLYGKEYMYLAGQLITAVQLNQPPVIGAQNKNVSVGSQVFLSGTAVDEDGTIASYSWGQVSGTSVSLSGPSSPTAQFVAPPVQGSEVLVFEFSVYDNDGGYSSVQATVTVYDPALDTDGDGLPDLWEAENNLDVNVNDAALDQDGDGLSNWEEYQAGTDPNDASPTVAISAPAGGSHVMHPAQVQLSGAASDPEDGVISGNIQWDSNLDGNLGSGADKTITLSPGYHTITASVTDSKAATTTAVVNLSVLSFKVTAPVDKSFHVNTQPIALSGEAIDLDGIDRSSQIRWASDIDGVLGVGTGISSLLSLGEHTVTTTVDNAAALAGHSITRSLHVCTAVETSVLSGSSSGDLLGVGVIGAGPSVISADGRYVVFESNSSELTANDGNYSFDVFVHDRVSGSVELISRTASGHAATGDSGSPTISADGRYVVFLSNAPDIPVSGATFSGFYEVFRYDRQLQIFTHVSGTYNGLASDAGAEFADVSGDGRYVIFSSSSSNLISGQTIDGIFLRDMSSGNTTLIGPGEAWSEGFDISQDGGTVVSVVDSAQVNGDLDIRIYDVASGQAEILESVGRWQSPHSNPSPQLSANGRYLVYSDNFAQIKVLDRSSPLGLSEVVSVSSSGVPGNGGSRYPSISADGRYVSFFSSSTNLVSNVAPRAWDLYVHDRQTGKTILAGISMNSLPWLSDWYTPPLAYLSGDGSRLVYLSRLTHHIEYPGRVLNFYNAFSSNVRRCSP